MPHSACPRVAKASWCRPGRHQRSFAPAAQNVRSAKRGSPGHTAAPHHTKPRPRAVLRSTQQCLGTHPGEGRLPRPTGLPPALLGTESRCMSTAVQTRHFRRPPHALSPPRTPRGTGAQNAQWASRKTACTLPKQRVVLCCKGAALLRAPGEAAAAGTATYAAMLAATGGISSETVAGLQGTPGLGTLSVNTPPHTPKPGPL